MVALGIAGCTATPRRNPANIPPVYKIRNSPRPVPLPRFKPDVKKAQLRARQAAGGQLKVRPGDTLYSLARQVGLPLRDLIDTNGLSAPYTLYVGQTLRLAPPPTHRVRRGETAYSIGRRYGVRVTDLMRANAIPPPYRLSIGQRLVLPPRYGGAQDTGALIPSASTLAKTRRPAPVTAPPRTSSRFAWPLEGKVISRFGRRTDGAQNDGINIAGSRGAAIQAAEDGVVVYASDALQGYGNLLLIRHGGGWITAYAHADQLLVTEGQKVKRGERVARVGTSGGVTPPQLHFEVRREKRAVDPLTVLERRG